MYEKLMIFRTAAAMAQHAGARQAVVARNIANADTPGYQAQRMPAFSDVYGPEAGLGMKATRAGHLAQTHGPSRPTAAVDSGTPSPNGNTVSLEEELLHSVTVSREHNRALAIYRHSMTVLRTALGRG